MISTTITTAATLCLYQSININQISQNISALIKQMNAEALSNFNFTSFIFAYKSIALGQSSIVTVSLAIIT
jgi:hypothetical protein